MGTLVVVAVVDSRVWLPPDLPKGFERVVKAAFTYSNPEFHRKQAMGFSTWNVPRRIRTVEDRVDEPTMGPRLTVPRGGIGKLREVAAEQGVRLRWIVRTTRAPVDFDPFRVDSDDEGAALRWYQREAVAACLERKQGIVRAPTGSGKTLAALAFIEAASERALVVMRDGNLLKQWKRVASRCLGLDPSEIGTVAGGKYRPGYRLTLALQQTLFRKASLLDEILQDDPYGAVVVDEVQTVAARTFQEVVDRIPTEYRIGFSADETRKDRKEFLIYDAMGPVIYEIDRSRLERERVVHPVTVRVVPTEFRADWYRSAEPAERDFQRLLDEMTSDPDRNEVLLRLVEEVADRGEVPAVVFTHRREHAQEVADRHLHGRGLNCGLLLGGDGADRERYQQDLRGLEQGRLKVAAGTFNAVGTGIDLPVLRAGVVATPISGKNRQFFGQVRGRICRTAEGKDCAVLYYLHDVHVYPGALRNLLAWNDGRVEVLRDGRWAPAGRRG